MLKPFLRILLRREADAASPEATGEATWNFVSSGSPEEYARALLSDARRKDGCEGYANWPRLQDHQVPLLTYTYINGRFIVRTIRPARLITMSGDISPRSLSWSGAATCA